MRFPSPLVRGLLVQRYKRFLADVRLASGETITAACPNTGSMLGLNAPGSAIWLSRSDALTRKYPHTWEMVEADLGAGPTLVGINPMHPNRIVGEAVASGLLNELAGYAIMRREVKYGVSSRIDLLLEDERKGRCYVEVKNVHLMRRLGRAEFPDSVTTRGAKHLAELSAMVAEGHRAVMVYLIQRPDAETFSISGDIDPAYLAAFDKAIASGVETLALRCRLSSKEIAIDKAVPITR